MKLYKKFKKHTEKLFHIESISSLLGWDQEICMSPDAIDYRASQISNLTSMHHDLFLSKEFKKTLNYLYRNKTLSLKKRRNVAYFYKSYLEATKLPKKFVEETSEIQTKAYDAWLVAKKESDFSLFKVHLSKLIENTKEHLSFVNQKGYNSILKSFDKGLNTNYLDKLFSRVKDSLIPIIKEKEELSKNIKSISGDFPKEKQKEYCLKILEKIGYDLRRGRLDESEHPFSLLVSPCDSRITVNYQQENLVSIWSALHEGGHGIYEQNLNYKDYSLPSGQALNYSIHESQSRFYEILIGKNINFWKNEYKSFSKFFGLDLSLEEFVKTLNKVERTTVRLEADDVSYHMHIIIRYEIEKMIFDENVPTSDLQEIWNEKYKAYLGKEPENDARSILQDCHWAMGGGFGYFPTYSLGTFYAHQFFEKLNKEHPDLLLNINIENLREIKKWLNKKVHKLGGHLTADEVCKKVTGEKLNPDYFLNYYGK